MYPSGQCLLLEGRASSAKSRGRANLLWAGTTAERTIAVSKQHCSQYITERAGRPRFSERNLQFRHRRHLPGRRFKHACRIHLRRIDQVPQPRAAYSQKTLPPSRWGPNSIEGLMTLATQPINMRPVYTYLFTASVFESGPTEVWRLLETTCGNHPFLWRSYARLS